MKIEELRGPYFKVTFNGNIPFTQLSNEETEGIFSYTDLQVFVAMGRNFLEDYDRKSDPSNVDTDPPDEYNVYSDQDGPACNTTVDGG